MFWTLSVVIFFIAHLQSFSAGSKLNSPWASRMRPWGGAFLQDAGLNYKGWRSQTSTQSPATLMINPRPIQRVHIPSKWKNIFAGSSVCFQLRWSSPADSYVQRPCVCFTSPRKNIKHRAVFSVSSFWRQIKSSMCLTLGRDTLCSGTGGDR